LDDPSHEGAVITVMRDTTTLGKTTKGVPAKGELVLNEKFSAAVQDADKSQPYKIKVSLAKAADGVVVAEGEADANPALGKPGTWGFTQAVKLMSVSNKTKEVAKATIGAGFVPRPEGNAAAVTLADLKLPIDGTVHVHVVKAVDIPVGDIASSDAFATLYIGGEKIGQTKVLTSTNPEWKEVFTFPYADAEVLDDVN
jgi:hypothetical protein